MSRITYNYITFIIRHKRNFLVAIVGIQRKYKAKMKVLVEISIEEIEIENILEV